MFLVVCRGPVPEIEEWEAAHTVTIQGTQIDEFLIDTDANGADYLRGLEGVLEVIPAPAGRFEDDTGGAVIVHPDGTWTVAEGDYGA